MCSPEEAGMAHFHLVLFMQLLYIYHYKSEQRSLYEKDRMQYPPFSGMCSERAIRRDRTKTEIHTKKSPKRPQSTVQNDIRGHHTCDDEIQHRN
jgi:hypothetical protein